MIAISQERLDKANSLLREIAACGRQFFSHEGRVSQFELDDRGRLCFRDKYKGELLLVFRTNSNRWHAKFTEGGTLKAFVEALSNYIKHGTPLPKHHLYWPPWYSDGDLWGYGPDMERVRAAAQQSGLVSSADNKNYHPTD